MMHHPHLCAPRAKDDWKARVSLKVNAHYNNFRAQKMATQSSTENYGGLKNWEKLEYLINI